MVSDLRFPALVLPFPFGGGVADGGGDGREEEASKTFCRLLALIHLGLGSGVSSSLDEEGVSCLSESETRARFRVGVGNKHNLGERRGEGGLVTVVVVVVVRRWTAICCKQRN